MEIAKCRWCKQDCFLSRDASWYYYVRSHCAHTVHGPSCATKEEAINMWNEMMYTGIPATLECTSTDYRDRVDRMAAAILAGYYANPDNDTPAVDTADDIAETAAMQIGSIDRMLKEREASL